MKRCIYCNKSVEDGIIINESHIIPDALTNGKITYANVCSVEHNQVFGDTFEFDIIEKCRRIRNFLNIKSKKGKIPSYYANLDIDGYKFDKLTSRFNNILDGSSYPVIKNEKKYLFKMINKSIDNESKHFYELIHNLQITEDLEFEELFKMLGSQNMLRLVAKIGYEWFCKEYKINGVLPDYTDIINSIVNENSNKSVVSIINNEKLLNDLNNELELGTHALAIYNTSNDRNAYVLFSFFGLILYKIRIRQYPFYIAKPTNSIDFYGFRSDGCIGSCKIYANNFDQHLVSLTSIDEINILKPSIAKIYANLLSIQIITLRSFKPFVKEITNIIKKNQFQSERLYDELIGLAHSTVITVTYVIYLIGKYEDQYNYDDTFQNNIKHLFNNTDKVIIHKNIKEELLLLFNSGEFLNYLLTGLSIFEKSYNKEIRKKND